MITLYRLGIKQYPKIQINNLDEHLNKLGFKLSENGAFYHKRYAYCDSYLDMGVICDNHNIYDIMAFACLKDNIKIDNMLKSFEKTYEKNVKAIYSLSMVKVAFGMGPEGGSGGLHNVNLDESFGGPRWWSYNSDEESLDQLESWITNQSRYNPEYLSIGRPLQIGEDSYTIIGSLNSDLKAARLNRDRQKVFLEYIDNNNQKKKVVIPSLKQSMESGKNDGDMAQEINKYQLKIVKADGKSIVLMKKKDTRGDIRGIWEINGRDSTPGFGYVDEDWKTSYSMHPEFLDDAAWTSGAWSPGRNNYDQGSRVL